MCSIERVKKNDNDDKIDMILKLRNKIGRYEDDNIIIYFLVLGAN